MNIGKQFEQEVRNQIQKCGIDITRLPDQTMGYSGIGNACDFIAYKYPNIHYIECKATKGGTLPFSSITKSQWEGLSSKTKVQGASSGFIIWFVEKDQTYWVSMEYVIQQFFTGSKSISLKKLQSTTLYHDGVQKIQGEKRRKFFNYDFKNLFTELYENLEIGVQSER